MKQRRKKKIYKDKRGREYHKVAYFIGGRMKFRRVYLNLVEGIPAEEFYRNNATVIDLTINGDYELLDEKNAADHLFYEPIPIKEENGIDDLPF